ncbi:fasciclin domain-containing protein [Tropicimonas sp. S265A]|uniref:fasciclin domain-containing protein n=1 Tax=Tropicimonas sp. S265A TaxID=3415134 RepID=UPI003C7A84FE
MNRRTTLKSLVAVGALTALTACGTNTGEGTASIARLVTTSPDFSTLLAAASAADLTDVLASEGPLTVFAPTNEAFAALPEGTLETLLLPENKETLAQIISYHVVPGSYPAGSLVGNTGSLTTAEGGTVAIDGTGTSVKVNDAFVTQANIAASNGVIHAIDSVMLP